MYLFVALLIYRISLPCLNEQLVSLLEETERIEKDVMMKRRTLELLPSARDNIGIFRLHQLSPLYPSYALTS